MGQVVAGLHFRARQETWQYFFLINQLKIEKIGWGREQLERRLEEAEGQKFRFISAW
jgi:hypothetical protein